jgi:hypothetical protein
MNISSPTDPRPSSSPNHKNQSLLELARREALATDAEWYRAVIGASGGQEQAEEEGAGAPAGPPPDERAVDVRGLGPTAQRLLTLGYSLEEAQGLALDIASVIVESGIRRPSGPLPAEWLAEEEQEEKAAEEGAPIEEEEEEEEGEEEYEPRPRQRAGGGSRRRARDVVPPMPPASTAASRRPRGVAERRRRQGRGTAAAYDEEDDDSLEEEDEEGVDEEERAYRRGLQAPIYKRPGMEEEEDDDFGPTFTEQEPGLLPILLDQVTAKMRASPLLRPLLREERFKYLLSQEADLRCVRRGVVV